MRRMIFRILSVLLIFSYTLPGASEEATKQLPRKLDGTPLNPLSETEAKAIVLVFLASDCPISNRYAPLLNRIHSAYQKQGIQFYGVYPMSTETVEGIKTHRKDFGYKLTALTDKTHFLVDKAEAMVTPEASVYVPSKSGEGTWVYQGRIDDLYLDFGKWRHAPTKNDLTDTLDKILSGQPPEPRRTRAVGCYIEE